jgi:hypothetical protein
MFSASCVVKMPARDWGCFLLWAEMRSRQVMDTHLKRQTDLAGRRVRISTTRSSVRLAAGDLRLLDLLPFTMALSKSF